MEIMIKEGKKWRNRETGYALKRVLIRGLSSEDLGHGLLRTAVHWDADQLVCCSLSQDSVAG